MDLGFLLARPRNAARPASVRGRARPDRRSRRPGRRRSSPLTAPNWSTRTRRHGQMQPVEQVLGSSRAGAAPAADVSPGTIEQRQGADLGQAALIFDRPRPGPSVTTRRKSPSSAGSSPRRKDRKAASSSTRDSSASGSFRRQGGGKSLRRVCRSRLVEQLVAGGHGMICRPSRVARLRDLAEARRGRHLELSTASRSSSQSAGSTAPTQLLANQGCRQQQ